MKIKLLLYITIIFIASIHTGIAQCDCGCDRQRDSLALVELYNSTNGPFWTINWNLSESLDQWNGITLNNQGCVSEIQLNNKEIIGELPSDLGKLECLTHFSIAFNELFGVIPPELGNLNCLTHLSLSSNDLEGSIPTTLGNLLQLESLGLNINNLSGEIPSALANLENLNTLALQSNQLEGCIPDEFIIFCDIDFFNINGNGRVAFKGDVIPFCDGENQIGSDCFINGQEGMIDENCNCVISTTLSNIDDLPFTVSVFPNPVKDRINIVSTNNKLDQIQIFDSTGDLIYSFELSSVRHSIDIKQYTAGIYFIQVYSGKQSNIIKILKE